MSHIVKLSLKVKDKKLFAKLSRESGFTVQEKEGEVIINSPSFYRPVTITKEGEILCDFMDRKKITPVLQRYVEGVVERSLRSRGYSLMKKEERNGAKVLVFAG